MAKYLDRPDLPKALINILTADLHVTEGKLSVTGLTAPPRIMQLRKRHDAEIVKDPLDNIWMTYGTLMHGVLEREAGDNALAEERLVAEVDGFKFSGTADIYENEVLWDYKTTSAYGAGEIAGRYEAQLNIYRWLYEQQGFKVNSLKILALYRDWSKTKAMRDDRYPQEPVQVIDVAMWTMDDALQYIRERIAFHTKAEGLQDSELPECTAEEKWEKPAKWAVMKKGRKSALKLHDSEFEAQIQLDGIEKDADKHYIEHRPGECIRCKSYCEVWQWCLTGQKIHKEEK